VKLEIRNLQSSATYEIGPDGAVLGREGSKADIVLRDQAVSKKHAKIYEKNGRWYLEDLASSNGTFVDNRRITEPVILSPGAVFALSENQFEVVQVLNGRAEGLDRDTESHESQSYGQNIDDLPPLGMQPPDDANLDKRSGRPMGKNQSARIASPAQAGADPADEAPPLGGEAKGVGYFFIAVPKAIAYYLTAIPLMLINPIGTIRKSVEEQKFPAMGWMELVAYALPVNLFSQLLAVVVTVIVMLVNGGFSVGYLLGAPIIAAVSAVVGSVITGLIFHPVMKWIINSFLKGSSDEKSRSNYFITVMTASALYGIPAAVTAVIAILARIPYVGPFFNIVPPLVQVVATGVMLFAVYTWFKHFNVVNWAQKVIMVLGILSVLGTGISVVTAVLNSIRLLGSGGSSGMVATADANAAVADAQKMAAEAMKNITPEQQAEVQKKIAEQKAALAKAGGDVAEAQEAARKLTEAAMKNAGEAEAVAKKIAGDAADRSKELAKTAEKTEKGEKAEKGDKPEKVEKGEKVKVAKKGEEESEEAESPTPAKATKAVTPLKPAKAVAASPGEDGPLTPFMQFIRRRELVEKAISEDPALLRREDILNAYKRYLKKTNEIRQRWAKKKSKDFTETRINDHLKDLEVFEGTTKMVDELHAKVFP
jgi:FHA domain-containing protein